MSRRARPRPVAPAAAVLAPVGLAPVGLAVLGLLAGPGCGGKTPPNVLLVTLDTTRFDVVGFLGRPVAADTPSLDALAREGVVFERAYTPVPSTLPSHASILTGLLPPSHGIHDNAVYELPAGSETLAEALREAGHDTAAFVSAFVLDAEFGLDQGFDVYDDEMNEPLRAGAPPTSVDEMEPEVAEWVHRTFQPYQRSADQTVSRAIRWVEERAEEPFFLWLHLFDPHEPYTPPESWVERYDPGYEGAMTGDASVYRAAQERGEIEHRDLVHMFQRYRAETAFADAWIGRLIETLRSRDVLDDTLIVVVADHGEAFGHHGLLFEHNSIVYEETVRVPLLVRFPDRLHAGVRVSSTVRTTDLAPTVLDWLGLEQIPADGRSLLPLVRGEESGDRAGYLQALVGRQAWPVPIERRGLLAPPWKLVRTVAREGGEETLELYDVVADPGETSDVAAEHPDVVRSLAAELDALVAEAARRRAASARERELDPETLERLRSLGYVH